MTCKEEDVKMNKSSNKKYPKVRNILEPGLTAPDGGWGWAVVAAAGISTALCLSILTCFGLIFRELGLSASQITTIINIHSGVAAAVGLANGPLFRKYSYRQVAIVSGFGCATSLCALSFMKTFHGIMFFFSIMYASSRSIFTSASIFSVITYFKKKRRIAVGLTWSCSGIGCILTPPLVTILMSNYGISGTLLIFGSLVLNTIACALVYQPVKMHAKVDIEYGSIKTTANAENIKKHDYDGSSVVISRFEKTPPMGNVGCPDKLVYPVKNRLTRRFESKYLHYCDQENVSAVEDVIALEYSSESCFNNDWVASNDPNERKRRVLNDVTLKGLTTITKSSKYADDDDDGHEKQEKNDCTNLDNNDDNMEYLLEKGATGTHQEREQKKLQWCINMFHAVAVFFNLDLLRDCIFLNIMFGIRFGYFAEINFVYMTPYILSEMNLRDIEVATVMSVFSVADVLARGIVPFIAMRVGWSNRTFFLIGLGSSALGRIGLAHLSAYGSIMSVVILCGIGQALTIVFATLTISNYVPLEKLPSATGLELGTEGMIFFVLGPLLGWFRDTWGNYTIFLHLLNVFCYLVIISWTLEYWCCSRKRQ